MNCQEQIFEDVAFFLTLVLGSEETSLSPCEWMPFICELAVLLACMTALFFWRKVIQRRFGLYEMNATKSFQTWLYMMQSRRKKSYSLMSEGPLFVVVERTTLFSCLQKGDRCELCCYHCRIPPYRTYHPTEPVVLLWNPSPWALFPISTHIISPDVGFERGISRRIAETILSSCIIFIQKPPHAFLQFFAVRRESA